MIDKIETKSILQMTESIKNKNHLAMQGHQQCKCSTQPSPEGKTL